MQEDKMKASVDLKSQWLKCWPAHSVRAHSCRGRPGAQGGAKSFEGHSPAPGQAPSQTSEQHGLPGVTDPPLS